MAKANIIPIVEKVAALHGEMLNLYPQLSQYTKGMAVIKGINFAKQLLEQLKAEEKEAA